MALLATAALISGFARGTRTALAVYVAVRAYAATALGVVVAIFYRGARQDVYNVLWAVVFGFATINILTLAGRRMEPSRRGLNFGEMMAVMVVLLSVVLLGWEMLHVFHIFPIKLHR